MSSNTNNNIPNSQQTPPPATALVNMSSSMTTIVNIKLDRTNYTLWLAQILPILKSHDLMGYVDGSVVCPSKHLAGSTTVNPAYISWMQQDQMILSWNNGSLTSSVLATVASKQSARATWEALEQTLIRLTVIAAFVMRSYEGESSMCLTLYEHGGAPAVFESQECLQWRHSDWYASCSRSMFSYETAMLKDRTRPLEDHILCALDFIIPFPVTVVELRRLELELLLFFMVIMVVKLVIWLPSCYLSISICICIFLLVLRILLC
ncbi:hypothetical protein ACFX13_047675 [Malus domestica]